MAEQPNDMGLAKPMSLPQLALASEEGVKQNPCTGADRLHAGLICGRSYRYPLIMAVFSFKFTFRKRVVGTSLSKWPQC